MSQDDRSDEARMRDRAGDIDDGMIHEWLDGELDAAHAAELEAFVASSPQFAARVAEARGLLAASSRILSSLDDVPRNVFPGAAASAAQPDSQPAAGPVARPAAPHVARTITAGWSARRWTGIAALLMVGVTGVVVARREPEATRVQAPDASALEGASAPTADTRAALEAAPESIAEREVVAPSAPAPFSSPAPSQPAVEASAAADRARQGFSSDVASNRADSLSTQLQLRAPAPQQVAPSVANARQEKVADAASQSSSSQRAAGAAASLQGGAPMRRMLMAEPSAATFELQSSPPSDIPPDELLLAVQRVNCSPVCAQLRIEIARDGRVRRWHQSLGTSSLPDTATLTDDALADLLRDISALRLDTLPAMLRLDGAQCRSVGSLRESLRVEFAHNNEQRRVMGLPWCSDGTHVLDKAAAAIEAAADSTISPTSGASSRRW